MLFRTDELIQKTIRDNFKECTVLTVAHHLRTIGLSLYVLSDGKLVEFDTSEVLLSNGRSYFASLVEQTGAAETEYLQTLANSAKSYIKRRREMYISDEESTSETNEVNPLVPSLKSL